MTSSPLHHARKYNFYNIDFNDLAKQDVKCFAYKIQVGNDANIRTCSYETY